MPKNKMHAEEVEVHIALVRRLIAGQFPEWAKLPIAPVSSRSTDHAIFRLGDDMLLRLPRIYWATGQVEKEQHWLPKLAPLLPVPISVPLAVGLPAEGYPWHWGVYPWMSGENSILGQIAEPSQTAIELAEFVTALQRIDLVGAPLSSRGMPLETRDAPVRAALNFLAGMIEVSMATAAWEAALRIPQWQNAPVWLHGDLMPGNLLFEQGRLSAVIDFGCMGVGDPACDLIVAWNFFSADSRNLYRSTLQVDEATWARGRGWALSIALIALPYYHETNPPLANIARRTIAEVLADGAL